MVELPLKVVNRVVMISALGIFADVYDYFLMGIVAVKVWPKVFLPTVSPSIALTLSLLAYLVTFASKPLGGILFGHMGDVKGRKTSMFWGVLMAAVAVLVISVIPSFLGAMGMVIITLLRFVQGVGSGGNHGSSVTLSYEMVMRGKKTRHKMWLLQMSPVLALMTSITLITSLQGIGNDPFFLSYGWRLLVCVSAVILMFRSYLRKLVMESLDYLSLKERGETLSSPVVSLVKKQWREMLLIFFSVIYYRTVLNFLVYPFLFKLMEESYGDVVPVLLVGLVFSVGSIFLGAILTFRMTWRKVALLSISSTLLTVPLLFLNDPLTLLPLFVSSSLGWGGMGYIVGEFDVKHRNTSAGVVLNTSDLIPSVLSVGLLPFLENTFGNNVKGVVLVAVEVILITSLLSLMLLTRGRKSEEGERR